jgi:Tol biopolymer transport system component
MSKTLRLKDLTSGSAVQIMPGGQYMDFAFSPDGKQIYYLTSDQGSSNSTLVRIPLFGGKPQEVLKNVLSPPAVSPDGRRIAVIKGDSNLTILDENGETGNLITSFESQFSPLSWNSQMSWSPDGERVALCGRGDDGRPRILDFSIKDRTGSFLPSPNFSQIDDVLWLADGSGLLITAKEKSGEPFQIWRVAYPSGKASRITRDFNNYDWISLSNDSKTLVVGQNITKTNVWIAAFDDLENLKQITFGSEAQDGFRGLAFTPDGKIIFTSPRSGNVDLWQINTDGGEPQPLNADQGSLNIAPRVTSDGRYIVFASSRGGDNLHIWRMDADGQNPLQLTNGANGDEVFYDISNDAHRVYYATANDQKQMTTRQVSINGGESSAIKDDYPTSGVIKASPDGKTMMRYVYLNKLKQPWRYGIFPIEGGEPSQLLEIPAYRNIVRWSADGNSFIYIKPGTSQMWRQPIDGSPPVMLSDLKSGWLFNFAVSPNYKQIAFAQGSQFSEAVLIENFGEQ